MPDAPVDVIGPYRVHEPLGEGGMGVVYRATHTGTDQQVALKTVRVVNERQLHCIRREIRALSRVRHPGVVRIVDQGVHEGLPWYAMELLRGISLREEVFTLTRGTSDSQLWDEHADRASLPVGTTVVVDLEDLGELHGGDTDELPPSGERPVAAAGALSDVLTLARRLCDPIAFLHGEGIVHRDLKPDNVLITDSRRPVLVDFGLMTRIATWGRERLVIDGHLHGTVSYMAPELIRGDSVDARADLYALGCILYELVTGRLPFRGDSAAAILTRHLSRPAIPPSDRVDGVPPALDDLILSLLAKRPADRVGYASHVATTLESLGAEPPDWALPDPRSYLYRPRLAGRQDQLDQLRSHLVDRATRVALIGGESGVGKTRLAVDFAREATQDGLKVLTGECEPVDAASSDVRGEPLAPLRNALVAVTDRCRDKGERETHRILGDQAPHIAPWAPDVLSLPGQDHAEPPPLEPEAARVRTLTALTTVLDAYGGDKRTILILDDLQWADDLTFQWLTHLARAGPGSLFVVATYRRGEDDPRLDALRSADAAVARLDLARLDGEAVTRMVADMLALSPPPVSLARFLATHSEGNPFFVSEYLAVAVVEGLLVRSPTGRWRTSRTDAGAPWDLPLPRSVQALVEHSLAALDPDARAVLEAAAVLGRDVDWSLLYAVEPTGSEDWLDAIGSLLSRQLLDEETGNLRFVHDVIREVTYAAMVPERRTLLHRRAARVLEDWLEDEIEDHLAVLAHHWLKGGDPAQARVRFLAGARRAAAGYDHGDAERLYTTFLELADDAAAAEARYELAVHVLHAQGRNAEALDQLGRALPVARADNDLHARVLEGLGQVTCQIGRIPDGQAMLREALALRRAYGDTVEVGQLLCTLGDTFSGSWSEARACYLEALQAAGDTGDRHLEARARLGLAWTNQRLGADAEVAANLDSALATARALHDRSLEARVLNALASHQRTHGDPDRALRTWREALEAERAIGDRLRTAVMQANIAMLMHDTGRTGPSHTAYAEALQTFRELGHHRYQGHATHIIGQHLRREGKLEPARLLNEQALVLLDVVGDQRWSVLVRIELATIERLAGDIERSRTLAEGAVKRARLIADPSVEAQAWRNLAATALEQEALERAREAAERSEATAAEAADAEGRARAALLLARIARRLEQVEEADRQLTLAAPWVVDQSGAVRARHCCERGQLAVLRGEPAHTWLAEAKAAHHDEVYLDPEVGMAIRALRAAIDTATASRLAGNPP